MVSPQQIWNLLAQSRLLDAAQLQHFQAAQQQSQPAAATDATALANWLIQQNVISSYQAKILLAGKSGPFFFGDYRVYDRVGEGRLKGRFRAVHQPTGHPVMLEFLTGIQAQGGPQWLETLRTVRAAADAPHAHLTRVYEAVDLTTHKFLVTEDLRGMTLDDRIRSGSVPVPETCAIVRQVLMAASHLHAQGRAHGDIRPGNIWLGQDGHARLLHSPTQDDVIAMSPERADYAAPELAQPGAMPTPLSDVYSFGCTLYHAISGRVPFEGGDVGAKMTRHANEPILPLENFGAPKALADAVMYMMAKNVGVRFASLQQVMEHVAAFASQTHDTPPMSPATQEPYLAHLNQKRAAQAAPVEPKPEPAPQVVVEKGPSVAIVTETDEGATLADQRKQTKSSGPPIALIAGGVAGAILLILILVFAFNRGGDPQTAQGNGNGGAAGETGANGSGANGAGETAKTGNGNSGANGTGSSTTGGGAEEPFRGLPDDGAMLWVSPTYGDATPFAYVPPGGQVFLIFRPAELLKTPAGADALKALDVALQNGGSRQRWQTSAGVELKDIDQLIVSLHGNDGRFPRMNYVIRLKEPRSVDDLRSTWGVGEGLKSEGHEYFKKGLYAYFPATDGSVFLMGAEEDVKEAAARGGAAPALRREVEQLRKAADAERHITVLFAPKFFSADGLPLFEGSTRRAREPLNWFLGDAIRAGSISMHFDGDAFFGEMRLISEIGTDSRQMANQLRDRISQVPPMIEDYVATRVYPPKYWRKVAVRLPNMVQFLHDQTRVGEEDGHAVLNFYLPADAAPNLALGGAMLMLSAPGSGPVATTPQPKAPQTLDELLARPTGIQFDQTSLEFAMRDIAADTNETVTGMPFTFKIRIDGGDLEESSITRNQQIQDFDVQNKPLSEVLTALVMKANPVPNVTSATQDDQKLVWVIIDDAQVPGAKMVLITTRKASAAKNYTLPKAFVP